MAWTLCTSGAAVAKAGANASSITASGAVLSEWSDEVEGTINTRTRKDWTANFSSVGANFQGVLEDLSSDLIAMKIINYDMSGYNKLLEAQTMLDVLRDNAVKNLEYLEQQKIQEVID